MQTSIHCTAVDEQFLIACEIRISVFFLQGLILNLQVLCYLKNKNQGNYTHLRLDCFFVHP